MKRIVILLTLFAFGSLALKAQGVQITGKVTGLDEGGPLPGVSVVVKGTTTGTVTDINGNYSILVPADAKTLVFSFIGMQTQEVAIGSQRVINVVLETDALKLDEVIVTAIGISRQQKVLGYSIVDVSADKVAQKSEPDLLRALQGKVPGVEIRSSGGSPGSATRITIRGASSFLNNNEPLFVVDGIPYSNTMVQTTNMSVGGGAYGNSLNTLDPNNIQSMSVLKGAAAAALYGSRAMNGVIVITTKTGNPSFAQKGLEVTVNSSVNFESIARYPEFQNTYGAGSDFNYSNANGSWGPRFDSLDSILVWNDFYKELGWGNKIPFVAQPDNVKDLFRTGHVYDNSVNIQGGSDRSAVSFTASATNNDGYIPHSSFNRYSVSAGGSSSLQNGLKVNGSVAYTNSKQAGGIFGNNQASSEEAASSFARGLWIARNWIMDPYERLDGGTLTPNHPQFDNPLWSWKHNQVITDMNRITANMGLNYDITSWFNISYKFGANTYQQFRKQIIDIGSRGYEGTGGLVTDDYKFTELESNLLFNFNYDFTDKINFTGVIGQSVNQRASDRRMFQGKKYTVPGIYDMNNIQNVIPYGGGITKRRLLGLLADMTLGYDGYLFLNLAGRNDWSSTLPPDNNSYFYPSISTSFLFTEAFESLKGDFLSFGKVRIAWGQVGQDAPVYSLYDVYGLSTPILGQPSMYTPNTGYSATLAPEMKDEFELGTNLIFFNNKIGIDFTWYNKETYNQILDIDVAASSGYTSQYSNVGKLSNKGIELGLNLNPVKTFSGFEWNMYMQFTKNKSKVLEIVEGVQRVTIGGLFGDPSVVVAVGQPYGVFYGDVNYRDDEGNLLIDPGTGLLIRDIEQDYYGDPNPDFISSLSNTFSFKGLTFNMMLEYIKGGDVYSNSIVSMLGRGVTKDTEDREKTVIIPGYYGDPNTGEPLKDANGRKIPNVTQVSLADLYFGESFAINSAGEWNVYDGTTVRIREISLGYELPKKLLQRTPFGSAMISVIGRNLWYYSPNIPPYTHHDMDVNGYGNSNVQGVEYSVAPSVKRIGFNLKLSF